MDAIHKDCGGKIELGPAGEVACNKCGKRGLPDLSVDEQNNFVAELMPAEEEEDFHEAITKKLVD